MSGTNLHSFALGIASRNANGEIIEVYYPLPQLNPAAGPAEIILEHSREIDGNGYCELSQQSLQALGKAFSAAGESAHNAIAQKLATSNKTQILTVLRDDSAPNSIPEAFLKLHLLSHRLAKPHELNLDGVFGVLKNLAWTNQGAIDLADLPARQLDARVNDESFDVYSVDKFPKMTSYVVPTGVRIADTARIRLGAHIGEGTTVMHEGFVNFNAGTEGTAMIEGRISAGVVVGENSDLGGGCSTMGTLSGGGTEIISVGKNCLIGANAGIGFPLADGCIVEAGLYVTAGTKINLLDANGELIKTAKAKEIREIENLLFRRNSLSGAVECVPIKNAISLNEELHAHN
ncbi:MAG: 2,3,4,5-tetrahydropyridine-2,6-dicarboxylate N-succinyltransferase [Pseudomonadales bacterium]|nr:2,3,4,5-tetrahydropyridine-2,6-dicarboxylate N-succinyltransferase [Pseudomonadales bacterium]